MRKNVTLWALFLPFFTMSLYLWCRGAVGHAFYIVTRDLYFVLIVFVFMTVLSRENWIVLKQIPFHRRRRLPRVGIRAREPVHSPTSPGDTHLNPR